MPTTITKTIGATSSPITPDYSLPQTWEDDIPADLVSADQAWEGQVLDQGEFVSATKLLDISAHTTDATRHIKLTTYAGASFRDKAGVRSAALYYNASNGAALRCTGAYQTLLTINCNNVSITNLQFQCDSSQASGIIWTFGNTGCLLENCIAVAGGGSSVTVMINAGTVRNCLIVLTSGSSYALEVEGTVNLYGVTVVHPGSASGTGVAALYGTAAMKDCCIFNFTNAFANLGGGGSMAGSNNVATDAASLPAGANNTYNLTFASQFESSTNDFRAKSSGGLKVGSPDGTNLPKDITDTTRDATTPWVGCWEISSGGGTVWFGSLAASVVITTQNLAGARLRASAAPLVAITTSETASKRAGGTISSNVLVTSLLAAYKRAALAAAPQVLISTTFSGSRRASGSVSPDVEIDLTASIFGLGNVRLGLANMLLSILTQTTAGVIRRGVASSVVSIDSQFVSSRLTRLLASSSMNISAVLDASKRVGASVASLIKITNAISARAKLVGTATSNLQLLCSLSLGKRAKVDFSALAQLNSVIVPMKRLYIASQPQLSLLSNFTARRATYGGVNLTALLSSVMRASRISRGEILAHLAILLTADFQHSQSPFVEFDFVKTVLFEADFTKMIVAIAEFEKIVGGR